MKVNKQNIIIIGSMALLLISATFLNHQLNKNKDSLGQAVNAPGTISTKDPLSTGDGSITTSGSAAFFKDYYADRENKRAEEVGYLDAVLADESTNDATRQEAQKQKVEIAGSLEKELAIETLLKAKGFTQVAAVFHTGSVNVVVGATDLSEAQVAQIVDVVQREAKTSPENIKIIPIE